MEIEFKIYLHLRPQGHWSDARNLSAKSCVKYIRLDQTSLMQVGLYFIQVPHQPCVNLR